MSDLRDLLLLVRSRYPIIVVDAPDETRVAAALTRAASELGLPLFEWTLTRGLGRIDAEAAIYDTRTADKALAALADLQQEGLYFLRDLPRSLDEPLVVRRLLELVEPFARDRRAIVLSGPGLALPAALRPYAARFRLALPDRTELAEIALRTLEAVSRQGSVRVELSPGERERLVESLTGLTPFEAERAVASVALDDGRLGSDDLGKLQTLRKQRLAADGLLELHPPGDEPRLCGLDNLRSWLAKRAPAWRPGAREFGLEPPRGLLLLGVPGCGKSLAARTVARDWSLPLLQLHFGRIFDKFIGESEARLERALADAERLAPCVLMIDEVEKALGTDSAADGGVSRRLTGRLLGWLQDRRAEVFVVATCNRVEDLPPELTRKGRFDETFFVDLPDGPARREIFAEQLRRRGREPAGFDLAALAEATQGFSGAEIEQAVVAGLYSAFADGARLTAAHVLAEVRTTLPLSRARPEDIARLRRWAAERAVPASGRSHAA